MLCSNEEKFINLMKSKIFALDKELNFGIYKIFKQSENQINRLLKEIAQIEDKEIKGDIYNYLYNFFSLYYEDGDFGYTKRAFAVFVTPYTHKEYQMEGKKKCFFESSHSFFYDGEETKFTWRTENSYYIKSNKYFNSITIRISDSEITFKIAGTDEDFDSKKARLFRLLRATKEGNKITLYFNISNKQTPKHVIYLFVKNMIEKDKSEMEYVPDEEFEKNPTKVNLFNDMEIEKYKKYLFVNGGSIFKNKKPKDEEKIQIYSIDLYLSKKKYANEVYKKKTEAKKLIDAKTFDFENVKDVEKLYETDYLLNFFYRLDRGFNSFLVGVDSDYFIHKNLERFLLSEMDKFIKNYILNDTAALLGKEGERLREKALIFKEKAEKIIKFLAAAEEFQKYMWEKRKLIKSIHYVVTTNKIKDDDLLNKILTNVNQLNEWHQLEMLEKLYKNFYEQNLNIQDKTKKNKEIKGKIKSIYEKKFSDLDSDLKEFVYENLKSLVKNRPFPVDTRYFDEEFKYRLLSKFENLEEEIDGILIKSENFQGLKFLEPKFKGKIKCIYIDPPYNTGSDGFVYKDNYKEASWLSMMNDRLQVAKELMRKDGVIFTQIDENESAHLKLLSNNIFGKENHAVTIHVQMSSVQGQKIGAAKEGNIVKNTEYIFTYVKNGKKNIAKNLLYEPTEYDTHYNKFLIRQTNGSYIEKNLTELIASNKKLLSHLQSILEKKNLTNFTNKDVAKAYQISIKFRKWIHDNSEYIVRDDNTSGLNIPDEVLNKLQQGKILEYETNTKKYLLTINSNGTVRQRILLKDKIQKCHDFNKTYGVSTLRGDWWAGFYKDMGNISKEDNVTFANGKKALRLIEQLIYMVTDTQAREWVLDFFAGSGTTPAVAYKMNKKFIAIEINDYFDDLLLKRIKFTMFGNSGGIKSQKNKGLIQYFYLQQYEELIENLDVQTKDINIEAKYVFNPLKIKINEVEIKNNLETLWNFIYHRGLTLKRIDKESDLLIGECENCFVVLGSGDETLEDIVDKFNNKKIYTNVKPKNNINYDVSRIEIISSADFKGI